MQLLAPVVVENEVLKFGCWTHCGRLVVNRRFVDMRINDDMMRLMVIAVLLHIIMIIRSVGLVLDYHCGEVGTDASLL